MLVIGARGHATEILDVLEAAAAGDPLFFFDDVTVGGPLLLYGKFPVLTTMEEAARVFETEAGFVIGIGGPALRFKVSQRFQSAGGLLCSVVAHTACVGRRNVLLGKGVNVMHQVVISSNVSIGEGALINAMASVHHDATVGEYAEISPGAKVLGRARVGAFCQIGANATVLPGITVGPHSIVGAGSVVTKDVPAHSVVVGVPARQLKKAQ